jgi:multidrug transporter EmrE-like cation transporter
MSQRAVIVCATLLNILVATGAFLVFGWNSAGAHAAARYTARLSVAIFVLAFAQSGLTSRLPRLPSYASMVRAFLGAHCVHFASVAITLALDKSHELRKSPGAAAAVIGIGFSFVFLAGLTPSPNLSRAYRLIHSISIFAVFAIFMLGYVEHPIRPYRMVGVLLAASLIIRIAARSPQKKARLATAG